MDRSVAQGRRADPETVPRTDSQTDRRPDPRIARGLAIAVGALLALAALAVYGVTYVDRYYDHFVWQAAAFLEGHAAIRFPVEAVGGLPGNARFQDVLPIATSDGVARGLLPFPPLPALVLVPFVAAWGLSVNDQAVFLVLAAIDVAICWWAIGRLPVSFVVRLATTVFFAFGTVFWYTSQNATTWYQAHIVAVGLTFLAIGIAVGADPESADDQVDDTDDADDAIGDEEGLEAPRWWESGVEPRQFMAGLLFGLASTARLTVIFGAPFFAFVGPGGFRWRSWSAGLGAAIPVLVLVLYNVLTTGQAFHPAYDHLYRLETAGYPSLGYHADWGAEDPRYLPQNLGIALFGTPDLAPSTLPESIAAHPTPVCVDPSDERGLFDVACPLAVPRDTGMSVILTSPAYLLAIPVLRRYGRSRLVTGAVLAVGFITLVNLMHFSQGWVQFGYRFSNDAAPFALILVALGFERLSIRYRWGMLAAMTLVVLSLAINLWGVMWSRLLGMVTSPRLVAPLLVGLVALAAASVTLLPGIAFWDTGELQAVGPLMGTAHPTGFPTYVLIGWFASVVLQPFGEPAFRMNLLSAICVAVAAGVTVDLVRRLTGQLALGVAAGIGLALTPTAWAMATHAETHTLHLAFVAILLWLLVAWDDHVRESRALGAEGTHGGRVDRGDRFLIAATAVFGLALGNHSLTILLIIPVGLYVLAVDPGIWRRGRLVLSCVGVLVLTVVLVYLELPLRAGPFRAPLVYGTPDTWEGFKYIVLAEQFRESVHDPFGELPRKIGDLAARAATQFGILAPLIPIGFIATALRQPRYALLTGTATLITCFFAASYVNADISRYYLGPALMAWTWLAVLAAAAVDVLAGLVDGGAVETDLEPGDEGYVGDPGDPAAEPDGPDPATAPTLATVVALVVAIAFLVPTLTEVTTRYAAVNLSRQVDAANWTAHALDVMEPGAAIVSWWSYSTPLWYAQRVQGQRPDITIIDDRTRLDENLGSITDVIDANLGKRPVYVIRLDPREIALLADRYDMEFVDGRDARTLTHVIGLKGSWAPVD